MIAAEPRRKPHPPATVTAYGPGNHGRYVVDAAAANWRKDPQDQRIGETCATPLLPAFALLQRPT